MIRSEIRLACVLACLLGVPAFAAPPPQPSMQFIGEHCLDCHDGDSAEAGFDLSKIGTDLSDAKVIDDWVKAFDRVNDGEMPPPDAGDVPSKSKQKFIAETKRWLASFQKRQQSELGRVQGRRLTNIQLERTLQDLFAIDVPLAKLMPEEPRTDGFIGIADGQSMSHFQLETHLQVVDAALDAAFARAVGSDKGMKKTFTARQIARRNPRQRNRDPEMLDGKAVVWNGTLPFYARISSSKVPVSSWYRITLTASSLNSPQDKGVWCSVRSGVCNSGAPLLAWVGSFEATEKPQQYSFDAWIPDQHMLEIRPADATLKVGRFKGGQIGVGEGEPQNIPGLALHKMTMEQIFPGGDLEQVRRFLFGKDVEVNVVRKPRRAVPQYANPARDASKQLRSFAHRAFRRPPTEAQLAPYVGLLNRKLKDGSTPAEALRDAYRAILCSPRFMYFTETPGELDAYAIATRLSYVLWNSGPDWTLMQLARDGSLKDHDVIHQQIERMLKTRRGQSFVKDFASQWLDLVDIGFTEPDRRLYRDFDIVIQNSMLEETHRYLQAMLHSDAPVTDLVKSNYSFLNGRLAEYYGITGVDGDSWQRVSLPAESHRGGLLTHGSILKVTANGTSTSPVLRGVWVADRILGTPIPPPPENIPAIEPDIRGAKSIRDMLMKHESDESCASCHCKIDPPGFALESFDAAGRWRDKYYVKQGSSIPVDASNQLADGRAFDDFDGFRDLIATNPGPLAFNFAKQLITYGTGAPITFADRDEILRIVKQNQPNQYGVRSLLKSVVTSQIYLAK